MQLLIKNARVIDAKSKTDDCLDVLITGGKIAKLAKNIKAKDAKIFDAKGLIVMPGLVDMHVHLREPGFEYKETILTGSKAAAAGGFTSVCCMPNTDPVVDNQEVVEFISSQSKKAGLINVFCVGAITKGLKGRELSDIGDLKAAGCVALSDDGNPVMNSEIMRRAMEYAGMFGLPIISHSEDIDLSAGGVMNEGLVSTKLGLKGIPRVAEISMVSRDIELSRYTGTPLHIAHVSCRESIDLIKKAKKQGIKVTCECTPHHFSLSEEELIDYDTNKKVNPPLRSRDDIKALIDALKDGTIDAIATDHAPHAETEKDIEFDQASFGIAGLETALGLAVLKLVDKGVLSFMDLVRKMSYNPASILNLGKGCIYEGQDADLTVFDPNKEWEVTVDSFLSKSKNSPFICKRLKGKVILTIAGGKKVYSVI